MSPVDVSVIIPAYNAASFMEGCLTALSAQTLPAERFEVILVDDGSSDQTAKIAQELKDRLALPHFQVIRQGNAGPAAARNRGIAEARGAIIAFLDSDCLPDPPWLEELTEPLRKQPEVVGVEGKTVPAQVSHSLFDHYIDNPEGGKYWTCNIAYRRDTLLAAGGLDENLRWCEDIDIAHRIQQQGEIRFNPRAVARHRVIPWSFAKHLSLVRTFPYLIYAWKKNPGAILPAGTTFAQLQWFQLKSIVKCLHNHRDWLKKAPWQYARYVLLIALMVLDTLPRIPYYYYRSRQPVTPKEPFRQTAKEHAA